MRLLCLILATAALPAAAQSCLQAEKEIASAYQALENSGSYSASGFDETAWDTAYGKLSGRLKTFLQQNRSWRCSFKNTGLIAAVSPDGKVRAFTWDNNDSGTMHEFSNYIQYRDAQGKTHIYEPDDMGVIYAVHQDTLPGYGKAYLLLSESIGSTILRGETAGWYRIEAGKFRPSPLFYTRKPVAKISYEFEYGDNPDADSRRSGFRYNTATHTLDFPVAVERQEDGFNRRRLTDRRIAYRFDGKYFVRQKTKR